MKAIETVPQTASTYPMAKRRALIIGGADPLHDRLKAVLQQFDFVPVDTPPAELGIVVCFTAHHSLLRSAPALVGSAPFVVCGPDSSELAIYALRAGAEDYLAFERLEDKLAARLQKISQRQHTDGTGKPIRKSDLLAGTSRLHANLMNQITNLACIDVPVLVIGETGTGKELVARALHFSGPRAHKPFVAVNCGAIAESLADREFFGHVRGAYTGAADSQPGYFKAADGGTLFLDEIGTLPLTLQPKLLRVLETREITPVGSTKTQQIDARIVCATNVDLRSEADAGRFRADLYYRIATAQIDVPSLRDRTEDIMSIAMHHLHVLASRAGYQTVPTITPAALHQLQEYSWPGNVRELLIVLTRALLASRGETIKPDHLDINETHVPTQQGLALDYQEAKRDFEQRYLEQILTITRGTVAEAARISGIGRRSFYVMLQRAGVDPNDFR